MKPSLSITIYTISIMDKIFGSCVGRENFIRIYVHITKPEEREHGMIAYFFSETTSSEEYDDLSFIRKLCIRKFIIDGNSGLLI